MVGQDKNIFMRQAHAAKGLCHSVLRAGGREAIYHGVPGIGTKALVLTLYGMRRVDAARRYGSTQITDCRW